MNLLRFLSPNSSSRPDARSEVERLSAEIEKTKELHKNQMKQLEHKLSRAKKDEASMLDDKSRLTREAITLSHIKGLRILCRGLSDVVLKSDGKMMGEMGEVIDGLNACMYGVRRTMPTLEAKSDLEEEWDRLKDAYKQLVGDYEERALVVKIYSQVFG